MDNIKDSDIQVLKRHNTGGFIGDDLLIIDNIKKAPIPRSARRMNFIFIGMCTKGTVRYTVDTKEFQVEPGDAIIISERHVVDHYLPSDDFEALCMVVSMNFFHEIIRNVSDVSALFLYSRNHPVMHFNEKEQQVFENYFQVIKSRLNDNTNHFRKELLRTLMLAMFYDLSNVIYQVQQDDIDNKRQFRNDAIFTRFIKMVEENCHHERRVSWYAEQLCITPKYLSEIVKQVSRRTPNEWIDNYVTLEIRVLLKNTTKSIKEIAEELNFPNQSLMGKYFKDNVGVTPSVYRRS